MKLRDKRKVLFVMLLSCLFTIMQIAGYQISMLYGTSVHQSDFFQGIGMLSGMQCVLVAVIEFVFWCFVIYAAFSLIEKTGMPKREISRKAAIGLWTAVTIVLFCCWIPCLLAGYPGFYNYDAMNQVPQALYEEVPYSAHHPLLHTLFMGKIIAFGYHRGIELNDGIILHSIMQMLICAMIFAYSIYYILKRTGRYWLGIAAFLYYAFFPPIAMFALSTTKDVIFSLLLLLSVLFLYEMCRDMPAFWASGFKIVRFLTTAVLMCLFRKNGIYALVCIIPFVIWMWKKYRKQLLILFAGAVVLYMMINKGLMWALDATEGSAEEALSVPIQQLARVYYDYGEAAFEEEEMLLIDAGIERIQLEEYNPFLSDQIKNYFDFNVILDNKMDYVSLWIRKGLQYPKAYIQAFLDNTYQAWYPGTSIYDDPKAEETYYFDMSMHAGGYRDSKKPELLEFYNNIAVGYSYQKLPVIRLLFSIGAMLWVGIFALGYAVYRKDAPLVLAMLFILFYCVTVLLGPISLVRYYLVLFYGFPVTLGFLLQGNRKCTDRLASESGDIENAM